MNGAIQVRQYAQLAPTMPGDLVDVPVIGRCLVIEANGSTLKVKTSKGDEILIRDAVCRRVLW